MRIGIRREDKSPWEARIPLVPSHITELTKQGIEVWIQPSTRRVFRDEELLAAGATITEDLGPCPVIMGVKEIPIECLEAKKIYIFFSHTIKGQKQNMPMLRRLQTLGCSLIDYERIVDEEGRRLVSFSRFAGLAGFLDALWLYGQRLNTGGKKTPLSFLQQSLHYDSLSEAKKHLEHVAGLCRRDTAFDGLTIAVTGLGRVGRGFVEMARYLEPKVVAPQQLPHCPRNNGFCIALFDIPDLVEHVGGSPVDPTEYRNRPDLYRSIFNEYLPHVDMLANGIYWEEPYPRIVTKKAIKQSWSEDTLRLQLIADISCDIGGSIELTSKAGDPGEPSFVYHPETESSVDGIDGAGVVVMANDILPTEFPRESSRAFSDALVPFVPSIARLSSEKSWDALHLPSPLKRAVVMHQGSLAENYEYMRNFL
ncbi:MAG: hypothetical protein KTR25_06120 [Myxococcales bacterium]|nr:hypothetical protein [Myxococcales bacterium]